MGSVGSQILVASRYQVRIVFPTTIIYRVSNMSGQQIEDLGDYLLHTELHDNWNGFSPVSSTVERTQVPKSSDTANSGDSTEYVTSPPLTSYTEMLKDNGALEDFRDPSKGVSIFAQLVNSHESEVATTMPDVMELANLSHQIEEPAPSLTTGAKLQTRRNIPIKPAAPKLPGGLGQSIWSSEDDDITSSNETSTPRMYGQHLHANHLSSCSSISRGTVINAVSEDDRGFRKKSREKMRRQEVNVKFEVLVDMLGFTNRARKRVVLHETVSAIKSLKRECNHLRQDRDRLQQEVNRLATYVQYAQVDLEDSIYDATRASVRDHQLRE
ncbi:hypothetical protein PHPALM_29426 [Phytophthora palmivora]|uniref:BHLH domain-containing protein n=1 Tax=Phytophthora palmivora TaxID=4796 RepID=A0A2P4X7M4_9STRA|nr:hypothetical protein PHPALM_29426 [Phytophthora palmivora]